MHTHTHTDTHTLTHTVMWEIPKGTKNVYKGENTQHTIASHD